MFADKAYGAVAYFSQGFYTSLVMSKTRVAPLKTLSLPRLELIAASSVKCQCNVHVWSDGQIVLYWIKNHKSSNHLSMLVSVKSLATFLLPTGITAQPLIIQLIYYKRYYFSTTCLIYLQMETSTNIAYLQDTVAYVESYRCCPITTQKCYQYINY